MIMFELSNNQHYILVSRKVVNQVKGLIKMNYSCVKQLNLKIWSNLQMQFWDIPWVRFAQLESHIWKVRIYLALVNERWT
jgi:hypothetical protein